MGVAWWALLILGGIGMGSSSDWPLGALTCAEGFSFGLRMGAQSFTPPWNTLAIPMTRFYNPKYMKSHKQPASQAVNTGSIPVSRSKIPL